MSVASSISVAMDAEESTKERLPKALLELQFQSSALVNFTVQWKELEDHFNELEKLMQKRFEELGRKGTENEMEKKSAAEKSSGNPSNEKEKKIAAEKSSGNPSNEKEKKSAAEKSSGNPNNEKEKKSATEKSIGNPNNEKEEKSVAEKSTGNPNKTSEEQAAAQNSTRNPYKTSLALKVDVKPCPQLKSLCEKIDGKGLKKFLVHCSGIRDEAPRALRCAADPAKLVLQTLEGFYPAGDGRKSTDQAERCACYLLLQALPFVLSPDEVSSEAKKDAQKIAAAWKSKHKDDSESRIKIEVLAFLQLLVSFGISKEFKDDDICELVLRISHQPEVYELCRALQISHKIPDIVEKLRSSRRCFPAVRFVYAFGLEEKISPVSLLKGYLEDEKKVSQQLLQNGRDPDRAQLAAISREIVALNAVIKFTEGHKLESQMPIKDLQKRVDQLNKTKSDRKRHAETIKFWTKRPCLSSGAGVASGAGAGASSGAGAGAGAGVSSGAGVASAAFALSNSSALLPKLNPPSSFTLPNSSDLYRPAPMASIPSYNLPGQGVYDGGSQGIYRSAYDVGSNPSSLSRSHLYPTDSLQSSLYGVGSFHGSINYGSYNIDSGVPPATSYQSSYLH